ncbi:MAG: type II secretion system protein [Anaerolineae bacterium]|nr:type II secretion system protein [Phycisphaerae bacterium]
MLILTRQFQVRIRRDSAPARPRGAFTLVELVMAMSIMAVLAAIAIPRYASAISAYRARAAAQRIVHDLAQVQSLARTVSSSRTIVFKSEGYVIANLRDLDTASTTYTVDLSAEPYNASIASVNLKGGLRQITFDGFGVPDTAGNLTVRAGSSTRTVTIDENTGKATVQ